MAYVSHVPGPSRIFDHVFDPTYEASSQKDVWKANIQAVHRSAPIQIMSIFNTMFSDMPNRPKCQYWKRQNPLPHFPFEGGISVKSAFMRNIERRKQICVEGACRCNYFHYPPDCIRTLNLRLSIPEQCKCLDTPTNKFQTVACQTVYRESSAQTRPYLPDYYIADGEPQTPEIVRVANLISGVDEPGEFEAKIVERARRRRLWENKLPPSSTPREWNERRKVIEAFEWEEFLAREKDIQDMQDLRMELVRKLVAERETSMRASSAVKLENARNRIEKTRKENLKKLHHKFHRNMRKLDLSRNNVSRKYKVENIVKEHKDRASDLYGPQMRFGIHPKRRHFIPFKSGYQARLDEVEAKFADPTKIRCPMRKMDVLAKPKSPVSEIYKGFQKDEHLKKLYETLKTLRQSANLEKGIPKCLDRIHKQQVVSAYTPLGPSEDLSDISELQCCIYLQKIIKGRAIQKILYNGRDRCRGLIEEIQSTHVLSAVSAMYPGLTNETIRGRLSIQRQQKRIMQQIENEQEIQEILKESEGRTVGSLLEFLEKELRRMYEQRNVHALCILAERERTKREAAEAGRRQTENRRRLECEEIYSEMNQASHDTVAMYLENVLLDEADRAAEDEARKRIQMMAKRIDLQVSKTLNKHCEPVEGGDELDLISSLVNDFMFPEVHKRMARSNMEERRQRHLLAAHTALYDQITRKFHVKTPRPSGADIASRILHNLIDRILSTDSILSKIGKRENVARHEAETAIRKILRRAFPDPKWKTSAERIVSATVSGLIQDVVENQPPLIPTESAWILELISEISDKLWKFALSEFAEHREETSKEMDFVDFLEDKLKPFVADYKESSGEEASMGSTSEFAPQIPSAKIHHLDMASSDTDLMPFPKKYIPKHKRQQSTDALVKSQEVADEHPEEADERSQAGNEVARNVIEKASSIGDTANIGEEQKSRVSGVSVQAQGGGDIDDQIAENPKIMVADVEEEAEHENQGLVEPELYIKTPSEIPSPAESNIRRQAGEDSLANSKHELNQEQLDKQLNSDQDILEYTRSSAERVKEIRDHILYDPIPDLTIDSRDELNFPGHSTEGSEHPEP